MNQVDEQEARRRVRNLSNVSRETELDLYVELLRKWQPKINLISPMTLNIIWSRHILDSAQIFSLAPENAKIWMDLGSGAGLPGIVLAILLKDRSGAEVHLVESDRRKAVFLTEAIRITGAPATVHVQRLEQVVAKFSDGSERMDVVTARALAPLERLVSWTQPLIEKGTVGLFLKGKNHLDELTDARKYRTVEFAVEPSQTDPAGAIVRAEKMLERRLPN